MSENSTLRDLLTDAAERGVVYRESVAERDVAPSAEAVLGVAGFIEPMPNEGTDEKDVLTRPSCLTRSCRQRITIQQARPCNHLLRLRVRDARLPMQE